MSHSAITVNGLGKKYQIGKSRQASSTFREAIVGALHAPWKRLKSLSGGESEATSFWALKDVDFQIARADVVGIIGRNGAGKSTLLKVLSRIVDPTEGEVRIRGRVSSLLEVGTGFHPELTGRENIFLNAAILGMKHAEIKKRFDAIVDFAEVEKFLDTPVKFYSSGMYVRLAFAVAAHLVPEVLIVDEVLAVGDAAFQKKCLGRMGRVANEGRTILFVSHNMAAVKSLCRRVIWMEHGRVKMDGPANDVVDAYLRGMTHAPESSFDVADAVREGHFGQNFRISNVMLNRGRHVCHGQPLHARLEFETKLEAVETSLGIGFSSLDGVRLCTLDSDLNDPMRPTVPAMTKGVVELQLDYLDLQPGMYMLDIGARSGDGHCLDYLNACGQVQILPGPDTSTPAMRPDGGVRLRGNWSWSLNNALAPLRRETAVQVY